MVTFSAFPGDPRPRRAAEALAREGMMIDLVCVEDGKNSKREALDGINVLRLPIANRRGGKLAYAYQYSAFILWSAAILAFRSLTRRYDLVHIHNMPDILVVSALVPKMFGAKVILDQHDPMPELMTTIFGLREDSMSVRLIKVLEKWSLARANLVLTVNVACKRIFSARSCPPEKIGVVMNSPDERIFQFQKPHAPTKPGNKKPFVIMYHGSLVERNGLDLAVEALAQVRKTVSDLELRVYGAKTPFLERVLDRAKDLGLQNAVYYLGSRRLEELAGEIDECDIGIVPNQRNAFTDINTPTRIFEYLALGKPVIAPSTPGIQDYFAPGSLFFFESGNADNLARAIGHAYSHSALAFETAVRGQEIYLAHTWREERQTLINLVSGLIAS